MNPIVEINLSNLRHNYCTLNNKFPNFWAVLKDNAYGLGISNVAKILSEAGCNKFMVTDINEALKIKEAIGYKDYEITILNGFFSTEEANICIKNNFLPFLSTIEQIDIWGKIGQNNDFAIFIETGLNRFSLRKEEIEYLLKNLQGRIRLVISHLACARNNQNARNIMQKKEFDELCAFIENRTYILEKSLCASDAAFYLDKSYVYDSVRLGSVLYGFNKDINLQYNLKNIISFKVPIIKKFEATKGDYIGYGDDCLLDKNRNLAIVNVGLTNGIYRSMSNSSAFFYLKDGKKYELPIIGRITMEYTTVDISDAPFLGQGDYIYLFDYNNHIKDRLDNLNYEDIIPRLISSQPLPYHKEFILYSLNNKNNIIYINK